ncbi:hypothetical protein BVRB_1g012100 [Beta vulgaris subsp. vulgaris]|nr:hypothetical protein BVRB_1g012100 [Beta vulgaris subsp. vulgaris]
MSDLSDSQNASGEAFLTESDPYSPSVDQTSEPETSPVGRTRLLADIPPTTDRERELRSKFLNDPSTPEEQNLTLRYLTASQSGDKQTLRELRPLILARRTRRHPPADAVPGLDVPPLREHAWLDSLADAGVRVSSSFYDRLQESVTPNPPIIDLGDDSDSPSAMAREDGNEATYQRRTDASASKAPMVEEDSQSGREEADEVGPGTNALWLPEDACNGPLTMTVQPKMTSLKGWQDAFFWVRVPDDYPVRRHFTEPAPHMEQLALKPLTEEELAAYDYFASADYDTTFDDGKVVRTKEPSIWLPHTKYILGDKALSALLLSPAHENGLDHLDHLDLDVLGVDSDFRPLTHLPAPPPTDYLTMHSSTNGRRGGNRHGPQTVRRRGRGPSASTRVPIVASTSAANSPTAPPRPSITRTVTRGGSVSRRRSREQTVEDSAANKRQAVEVLGTSTMNEVLVEDLDPSTEEPQVEGAAVVGVGTAGGGSLKKEVPLSDTVAAAFAPQTVTPGKIDQPNWDVREDESLYSDIPKNGGILAYCILKGMQLPLDRPSGSLKTPAARLAHDQLVANNAAIELIEQYLEYQRLADSYKASLETCQDLLQEAEKKVAPLEDEVATLRDRAALLEETEENVKALTKAVEAANTEKDIAVLEASAAEARGAAKAVADFRASDESVI